MGAISMKRMHVDPSPFSTELRIASEHRGSWWCYLFRECNDYCILGKPVRRKIPIEYSHEDPVSCSVYCNESIGVCGNALCWMALVST